MGTVNTITISAAVSAIVTVLVGTLLNWGERVVSWTRRTIPPDHAPLASGGGWAATRVGSSGDQVRVLVCCAPNRSVRKTAISPDKAVNFVRTQFPGLFPDEPVFSMPPLGVQFESADRGVQQSYAWVHASGRIDLCLPVPTATADPEHVTLDVLTLLDPLSMMLRAVKSAAYDEIFGVRPPGFPRRFDWGIAVSTTVTILNRGSISGNVPWQELIFPGRTPPRAGTRQQPFCPIEGYAAHDLRNYNIHRRETDLMHAFLRDFLQQNGFHDVEPAIADTLQSFTAPPAPLRTIQPPVLLTR